jgi:ABC-2 type transport system permease protein
MRKYIIIFKNSLQEVIAEKETSIIWSISSAVGLIGMIVAWLASDKTVIGDYTKSQLVTYYLIIFFLEEIMSWFVFWELREAIMNGNISNFLLKPMSYLRYVMTHETAVKLFNFLVNVVVSVFFFIFASNYIELDFSLIILLKVIPTMIIGIGIMFFIHFIAGTCTFFFTESGFVSEIMWIFGLALGGSIMPLGIYPESLRTFLNLNPFRYTFSLQTEILQHKIDDKDYLLSIGIGLVWLILLYLIYKVIWKAGLKKYSAYGS